MDNENNGCEDADATCMVKKIGMFFLFLSKDNKYHIENILELFLGEIYSHGCAFPDHAESIFQTRGPDQFCEWRDGAKNSDAICFCETDECNSAIILDRWIKNGDCGKDVR